MLSPSTRSQTGVIPIITLISYQFLPTQADIYLGAAPSRSVFHNGLHWATGSVPLSRPDQLCGRHKRKPHCASRGLISLQQYQWGQVGHEEVPRRPPGNCQGEL